MVTTRPGAVDRKLRTDVILACVVPAVQLALLIATGALRAWMPADALTIALVLIQGVPLAARRAHPWAVFAVVLTANSVYYALGLPPTGYDFGLAIALYTIAERKSARASVLAYAVVVAEIAVMKIGGVGPFWSAAPWFLVSYLGIFFGAAWAWGRYQHLRADRLADLVAQAARDRSAAADAARREERTRIARELHDVIAHHLSLMVVQAGGARRLLEQDPARAKEALTVIEEYGRRGLDAMPGLLQALRADADPHDRGPAPQLSDVAALIETLRRSGLSIELAVEGEPRPLPERVELSAYRIVQESVTNVVRHAPGATTRVRLDYGTATLLVEVVDDGPGLPPDQARSGHGLIGLRERVRLLGGRCTITSLEGGGTLVRAALPVGTAS